MEIWDIYDGNRIKTGRTAVRGERLGEGEFHLVVHVWIVNRRGEYLITKRSPGKSFPGMWECTGGSALAGEDSREAALREVREETGLILYPACGRIVMTLKRKDNFADVWLFRTEFDLSNVVLQEGETCDVMKADENTVREMIGKGEFCPYAYLDEFFDAVRRGS